LRSIRLVWVTVVAWQTLLYDTYKLESLQEDGSRTRQEIPQTAGWKAQGCFCCAYLVSYLLLDYRIYANLHVKRMSWIGLTNKPEVVSNSGVLPLPTSPDHCLIFAEETFKISLPTARKSLIWDCSNVDV